MNISSQHDLLQALLSRLDLEQLETLQHDWPSFARPDQLPPVQPQDWSTWLVLGGRGAGKTRTGAEWIRAMALGLYGFTNQPVGRIALVAETHADVREVMVEGVSGLRSIGRRDERPVWISSRRRLEWPNGAIAYGFSSEDPEGLRGPQFGAAWLDELGKWKEAEATWDMLQFGLRLGATPKQIVTTTPRPIPLLKRLAADPKTALSRASTAANRFNLAPAFLDQIVARYQGTRLGRQEIDGEFVEERADALFPRDLIERARLGTMPEHFNRVVVAVDPPAGGKRSACCGIVVAGLSADGTVVILEDASIERPKPEQWAERAISAYQRHEADALVCEINMGGDMVETIIHTIAPTIPVTSVRATRGKALRAEPVAALYAQGRVKHAVAFPQLEDQMALFGPDGLADGTSPDRLDALVWAVTALALTEARGRPRVRGV